ncbi:MAG: hypothetical protein ACOZJX_17075 [Pseudomonadota bacterium]
MTRLRDSFFAYHGLWAPGVRLFRRLGFRAKALIVSGCFVLPLLVLGSAWFGQHLDQRDFTRKEVEGLAYARQAMPLLPLALRPRADAAEWQLALQRVEDAQAASGDAFSTAAPLKALKERAAAVQALAGAEGGPAAQVALVKAVVDLVGQATDGSNLTLDPDIDTYYLMDGSLMRVPQYLAEVGRVHALAAASAAGGADGAAVVAMHRAQAYADLLDEQLDLAAGKVDALHPGAREAFGVARIDGARTALYDAVAAGGDAAAVTRAEQALVEALLATQQKMFTQLDALLAARLDRADAKARVIACWWWPGC